ncbi:hypothetical protein Bca52824_049024 [Brassica carinata]|uniref:Uncharacterized protein n=1 Tax=Brassica carinata TaxID=52824 RepID=A0A8X7RM97_BRACI|nr:hypothetical protein Bca52824_049024 [Brassica carinata]
MQILNTEEEHPPFHLRIAEYDVVERGEPSTEPWRDPSRRETSRRSVGGEERRSLGRRSVGGEERRSLGRRSVEKRNLGRRSVGGEDRRTVGRRSKRGDSSVEKRGDRREAIRRSRRRKDEKIKSQHLPKSIISSPVSSPNHTKPHIT